MMATVGIRELKNRLSNYVARARRGERITVTDRGRVVAILGPPTRAEAEKELDFLVREGSAAWYGGRPAGSSSPVPVKGKTVSEIVIEERR